jgi:DNA-binding protein HU-beta
MKPRKVNISSPKMSVDKKELVRRVSQRLSKPTGAVEEIIDATIEEIYESLKLGDSVALRNFGTFVSQNRARLLGI